MNAQTDFSKATIKALAEKGIRVIGRKLLPDAESAMPYASAALGYALDDNGCYRIRSLSGVLKLAGRKTR